MCVCVCVCSFVCDLLPSAGARPARRVQSAKAARGPLRVSAAQNDGPNNVEGPEQQQPNAVAVAGVAAGESISVVV